MDAPSRRHGSRPFHVVVVHGGPGGARGVRPVAEPLGHRFGSSKLRGRNTQLGERVVLLVPSIMGSLPGSIAHAVMPGLPRQIAQNGSDRTDTPPRDSREHPEHPMTHGMRFRQLLTVRRQQLIEWTFGSQSRGTRRRN